MSTTGRKTPKGFPSWIKEVSPDDPIYTRGYVVGGNYSTFSSKGSAAKTISAEERKKLLAETDKIMQQRASDGMLQQVQSEDDN